MSLAHQEKVFKSMKVKNQKSLNFELNWDKMVQFGIQWLHNPEEYQLKKEFSKAHLLSKERSQIVSKLEKINKELETLQSEDGVGVVKKLLYQSQSTGYLMSGLTDGSKTGKLSKCYP